MSARAIHFAHAACPSVPWRNGGGVAREIAAGDGWALRSAEIGRSGPFSRYAGVTRHFALVQGRVCLSFEPAGGPGVAPAFVGSDSAQGYVFDGDLACECRLLEGDPAIALNLMVDARRVRARIWRVAAGASDRPGPADEADEATTGFMCTDGAFRLDVFVFVRQPPENLGAANTAPNAAPMPAALPASLSPSMPAPMPAPMPVPQAALDAGALCFRIERNAPRST